jgi:uncharacterized protein YbbC (DUF1343 family)
MRFGIDRLLADPALRRPLVGKRLGLVAHPASVTRELVHTLDALAAVGDLRVTAAFGPQHGLRGDKQDNMVESPDFQDPVHGIPVFSLYGAVRRPTDAMLDACDVLVVDLQDVGCRIYTFITTLLYVLEAGAAKKKAVWILDRPNPAGRPVEGLRLRPGNESFVGAGPLPMRHGLTMGELARWFVRERRLDVECEVVTMDDWRPADAPGYGWPLGERSWVNPSPNIPTPWTTRTYPGTVLLEGTTLSEGRASSSARPTSTRRRSSGRWKRSRRSGSAAAASARAGSSRRSTSTSAPSPPACRSTSTIRATSTRPSDRGGSSCLP